MIVIFEVSVDFTYSILSGIAEMEFSFSDRSVTCPTLVIEYGGEPTVVGARVRLDTRQATAHGNCCGLFYFPTRNELTMPR